MSNHLEVAELMAENGRLRDGNEALVRALKMFIAWDDNAHEGPAAAWHDDAMLCARDALKSVEPASSVSLADRATVGGEK